jgi:YVTN family beta-propeller protein
MHDSRCITARRIMSRFMLLSSNPISIDTSTNTVEATVAVGNLPIGIAFSLDGKHAYVANEGSGDVSVIRTAKQKVVTTVAVGTNPFGVGIRP